MKNKFLKHDDFIPYVKRLGQRHYFKPNTGSTACGMSLLGNNYFNVIPTNEQKECEECASKILSESVETSLLKVALNEEGT